MSAAATAFALVGGVALGAAIAGNSYAQPYYAPPPPVVQPVYYQPQPVVYTEVREIYRPVRYGPPPHRWHNRWDDERPYWHGPRW